MKKTTTIILSSLAVSFFVTASALASTNVSLESQNISVTKGQDFSLTISLDPQSVSNYTAKIELLFPAELVSVKSFSFASNWMGVMQPGYDLIDNAVGKLIKTAGYPSGVSSLIDFGTVVFSANETGIANIQIDSNSAVYDANSQNVISQTLAKTSVTISVPQPVTSTQTATVTPKPAIKNPVVKGSTATTSIIGQNPTTTNDATSTPAVEEVAGTGTSFLASVGSFVSSKNMIWVLIIILVIIAITIFIKKSKKQKEVKPQ
jgi:hypothetical protein